MSRRPTRKSNTGSLPTPTSSPVTARVTPTSDSHKLVHLADEYMAKTSSNYTRMTQAEIRQRMAPEGLANVSEEVIRKRLEEYNARFEAKLGSNMQILGVKPTPNDPDTRYVDIPNTDYAIRLYDGGMSQFGQCCLDFTLGDVPVNKPASWTLYPLYSSASLFSGPMISWESALGVAQSDLIPGAEKFNAPQGSAWQLVETGTQSTRELARFMVPFPAQETLLQATRRTQPGRHS